MRCEDNTEIPYEELAKYLTGDPSEEVRKVVFIWLGEQKENEMILKRMDRLFNTSLLNEASSHSAFKILCQKIKKMERI